MSENVKKEMGRKGRRGRGTRGRRGRGVGVGRRGRMKEHNLMQLPVVCLACGHGISEVYDHATIKGLTKELGKKMTRVAEELPTS